MSNNPGYEGLGDIKNACRNTTAEVAELLLYSFDASGIKHRPDCVVFPESTDEVSAVVKVCAKHGIPVTPRGAGTGYTGAAVPASGGVVMVFTRMRKVLSINREALYAEVEPGIVNHEFGRILAKKKLFYPPDPASLKSSTIGGNVMTGAGGPSAVKYGVTRDYVMGLTVVLADGSIIDTGTRTAKGVVGYDLTRLMVGSEGTLGIACKIRLKILPMPEAVVTATAIFAERKEAIGAACAILGSRLIPRTLEYIDRTAIRCVEEYLNAGLPVDAGGMLLLETDGDEKAAREEMKRIESVCNAQGAENFAIAQTVGEAEKQWELRRAISASLRRMRPTKINEDVTVPRDRIAELIEKLDELSAKTGLPIINFGHAGDGNIHVNVMTDKNNEKEYELAMKTVEEILDITLELGGTISGEHGIGMVKVPYIAKEIGERGVAIGKSVKKAFDPQNILNPHKIFP